mgnify:CR=1 FL=1
MLRNIVTQRRTITYYGREEGYGRGVDFQEGAAGDVRHLLRGPVSVEADGTDPGAWFLRRSTSTGQETFFRRDQICQRIRLILDNKEHQTLDELAASLAEKRQTVLARRKLIIETAYGRREFPLEEVRSAVVAEGTHQEDILQLLKEITL